MTTDQDNGYDAAAQGFCVHGACRNSFEVIIQPRVKPGAKYKKDIDSAFSWFSSNKVCDPRAKGGGIRSGGVFGYCGTGG